jgi:hypothetical protein
VLWEWVERNGEGWEKWRGLGERVLEKERERERELTGISLL